MQAIRSSMASSQPRPGEATPGKNLHRYKPHLRDWRPGDPTWMTNADALIGNAKNDNSRYCLVKPGSLYLVYLPTGSAAEIDLSGVSGTFTVQWFDPRGGGPLQAGSVPKVSGGGKAALGTPPTDASDDWLIVITQ